MNDNTKGISRKGFLGVLSGALALPLLARDAAANTPASNVISQAELRAIIDEQNAFNAHVLKLRHRIDSGATIEAGELTAKADPLDEDMSSYATPCDGGCWCGVEIGPAAGSRPTVQAQRQPERAHGNPHEKLSAILASGDKPVIKAITANLDAFQMCIIPGRVSLRA